MGRPGFEPGTFRASGERPKPDFPFLSLDDRPINPLNWLSFMYLMVFSNLLDCNHVLKLASVFLRIKLYISSTVRMSGGKFISVSFWDSCVI